MSRRSLWLWLVVVTWWTLYGIVLAVETLTIQTAAGTHVDPDFAHAFRTSLSSAWIWIPLTVVLIELAQRYPIERGRLAVSLSLHGLAVVVIIAIRAALVLGFNDWIGWYPQQPDFSVVLASSVAKNSLIAWLIVGVSHALLYYERANTRERQAVELEARLAQARLQALSAQLNPHFLFNALNSVAELVHRSPAAADRMLVSLGQLLRASLEGSQTQEVPLREELALLERYIELEKMRLEDRLRIYWEIDRSLLSVPVPRLLLQPLVENAIRYALGQRTTPGKVVVRVARQQDWLVLEVRDDGDIPPEQAAHNGNGIGLSNTRARLRALYGDQHTFALTRTEANDGTVAQVKLPIRVLEQAHDKHAA